MSCPTKFSSPGTNDIIAKPLFFLFLFCLVDSFTISPNLAFTSSNLFCASTAASGLTSFKLAISSIRFFFSTIKLTASVFVAATAPPVVFCNMFTAPCTCLYSFFIAFASAKVISSFFILTSKSAFNLTSLLGIVTNCICAVLTGCMFSS